jgi:hypothetical protein
VTRRRFLWHAVRGLGGLTLVAGLGACADTPDKEEQEKAGVPKPEWRVGDRWVFQRTSLGGTTSVVTYQVVEATGDGYALRLSGAGPDLTSYWTDELALRRREVGGRVVSRFEPAAPFFRWPLKLGERWDGEFDYTDGRNDGRYRNVWAAGVAIESINVVAGRFYSVRIEQRGGQGRLLSTYWYSPLVRYWVRQDSAIDGFSEELVEFRPWQ